MKKILISAVIVFILIFISSCEQSSTEPTVNSGEEKHSLNKKISSIDEQIQNFIDVANSKAESQGSDLRILMAEYITNGENGEVGNTVLAKTVGNKQLSADFVPFDPRRVWSGPADGTDDDITYAIDQTADAVPPSGGLTAAQTTAAIDRAMQTWENVKSTNLPITKNPDLGLDLGYTAAVYYGVGGSGAIVADIMHSGFTDLNFAGGVLGVTFTWFFTSGGNPTDIDNNGKADCALRDIYYDPSWIWADDGISNIDVESVALHEAGHGLSQGHFGTVKIKNDGTLQASPWAVMNALYAAPRRELEGTDIGGHSSIWGRWPNN